jgi:pilus assembly protein CpaB
MNQKRIKIIAVACGVVCAVCVLAFMMSVQGSADAARAEALERYGGAQVDVYVAKRDIAAGERIESSMVEAKSWASDLLPEDALRSSENVVGRTASSTIYAGEVLVQKRFDASEGQIDVPSGTTAVSVPAKSVQAVGGALKPGMYVDVYSTGSSSTSSIAKDVLVLASSAGNSSSSGGVTIAVPDSIVQQVVASANSTELYFSLPSDKEAGDKAGEEK